jgi:hypothetical protein
VACFPARKRLPNGQNAHCTIRPLRWWRQLVGEVAHKHPGVLYEFRLQFDERGPQGTTRGEEILTNRGEWSQLSEAAP